MLFIGACLQHASGIGRFTAFQSHFITLMDYPQVVQIETATGCVASCSFCPHSGMGRNPKGLMDRSLFDRLIDQIATWDSPPRICPFLTNEPLQDPRLGDLLRYINDRLPESPITIFTNGALFSWRRLRALAGVRNVETVFISLHHSTAREYKADLGLSFASTLDSINRFHNWNEGEGFTPRVVLLRVQDGNEDRDVRFIKFCAKNYPGWERQLSVRWNWKGDISSPYPAEVLDIICPRHSSMCVLADGRVALCCMDQAGQYALGDANTETLLGIYNGERARSYRTRTKRESVPCLSCNMTG